MRRLLEFVSLAALAVLVGITVYALAGPHPLPDRIAIHFNGAGQANGWGSPQALLGLPIAGVVLYGLMTIVARRPAAFNFPARVTPANRPRLEALAVEMIAWLKAEVMFLFLWIQNFTIQAARSGHGSLPPLFMPVTLAVVLGTILIYFLLFRQAAG